MLKTKEIVNDTNKEEFISKSYLKSVIETMHCTNIDTLIEEWGTEFSNTALAFACGSMMCAYKMGLITEELCDSVFDLYADICESIIEPSCYCFNCEDKEN